MTDTEGNDSLPGTIRTDAADYDYSPDTHERRLERQRRVANWIQNQSSQSERYTNPFQVAGATSQPQLAPSRSVSRPQPHSRVVEVVSRPRTLPRSRPPISTSAPRRKATATDTYTDDYIEPTATLTDEISSEPPSQRKKTSRIWSYLPGIIRGLKGGESLLSMNNGRKGLRSGNDALRPLIDTYSKPQYVLIVGALPDSQRQHRPSSRSPQPEYHGPVGSNYIGMPGLQNASGLSAQPAGYYTLPSLGTTQWPGELQTTIIPSGPPYAIPRAFPPGFEPIIPPAFVGVPGYPFIAPEDFPFIPPRSPPPIVLEVPEDPVTIAPLYALSAIHEDPTPYVPSAVPLTVAAAPIPAAPGILPAIPTIAAFPHKRYVEATTMYEDPDKYMLSILSHLLLSSRGAEAHTLETLRRYQQSPSPYRDLVRFCASHLTETDGLSDMILCAMQESYDELVRQSGSGERRRFARRMLIKVSQKIGTVPSSLFVQGVFSVETSRPEGMGGFADVFRGSKDGRGVALKRLRISNYLVAKHDWKRPFYREALLWRQLRHANILEFIGLEKRTFEGCICMVSPWMANGDIARYLATHDERAARSHKCKWILQIMAGLSYLHDQGMVHGDFRGANILLEDNFNVRIADFGLSVLIDAGMSTMGVTTMREGAVRWMAPETIETGKCTTQGDMYSFGCVCLEIFSGTCPFPDLKNDKQVIHHIGRGKRPEWRMMHKGDAHVVDALGKLAKKCWVDDPTNRPNMSSLDILSSINDESRISGAEAASQLWRLLSHSYSERSHLPPIQS